MSSESVTDIEYVYVEMVLNKEHKYEVVSGIFQGIKVREGSTFILLHGKKDVTNIVSLSYYNIMTIEILHKDHKDMTYLTIKEEDQKVALKMIGEVYKGLLKDNFGKGEDGDLINIKRYTNIPEECGGSTTVKPRPSISDTSSTQCNGVGNFANTNNRASTTYLSQKKEIVPSVFNRSTGSKKPTKASLELMREKIDQINDGKFVCDLPEMVEATEDDKEETDHTNLYERDNLHWA